nr:MAG TPA: hypothetical protein [Caudoviricetes sp.]DAX90067.1 MAG TPA: hypothetical protein [Caudoviricetes sp.]
MKVLKHIFFKQKIVDCHMLLMLHIWRASHSAYRLILK